MVVFATVAGALFFVGADLVSARDCVVIALWHSRMIATAIASRADTRSAPTIHFDKLSTTTEE